MLYGSGSYNIAYYTKVDSDADANAINFYLLNIHTRHITKHSTIIYQILIRGQIYLELSEAIIMPLVVIHFVVF